MRNESGKQTWPRACACSSFDSPLASLATLLAVGHDPVLVLTFNIFEDERNRIIVLALVLHRRHSLLLGRSGNHAGIVITLVRLRHPLNSMIVAGLIWPMLPFAIRVLHSECVLGYCTSDAIVEGVRCRYEVLAR